MFSTVDNLSKKGKESGQIKFMNKREFSEAN